MKDKRYIDQTYFKINGTSNNKVAWLEVFLNDNKYTSFLALLGTLNSQLAACVYSI